MKLWKKILKSTYQSKILGDNNPSANPRMSAVVRVLDEAAVVVKIRLK